MSVEITFGTVSLIIFGYRVRLESNRRREPSITSLLHPPQSSLVRALGNRSCYLRVASLWLSKEEPVVEANCRWEAAKVVALRYDCDYCCHCCRKRFLFNVVTAQLQNRVDDQFFQQFRLFS